MGCFTSRTAAEYESFIFIGFPLEDGAIHIEEITEPSFGYSGNPVILGCKIHGERLFFKGERLPDNDNSVILVCSNNELTSAVHKNNGIFGGGVGPFIIADYSSLDDFACKVPIN